MNKKDFDNCSTIIVGKNAMPDRARFNEPQRGRYELCCANTPHTENEP